MPSPLEELIRYGRGEFSQNERLGGEITNLGEREQRLLEEIRKYDPNANWKYIDNSGSSNEGGTTSPNSYTLEFDQSKLPSITDDTGVNRASIGSAGQIFQTSGKPGLNTYFRGSVDPKWDDWFNYNDNDLASKGHRWTDENYGDMSFGARKKEKFNWGSLAPMLVALAATAGTGGASLGMLGNLLYGAGPTLASTVANGGDLGRGLLTAGSGFIPGLAGLTGLPAQLASLGLRSAINGHSPDPMTLAQMLARYGISQVGKG